MNRRDQILVVIIIACAAILVLMAGAYVRPAGPVLVGGSLMEKLTNLVAGLSNGEMLAVLVALGLVEAAMLWDILSEKW